MRESNFKVGYITSLFPCWSETFVLNEIVELKNQGIDVSIFSIRNDLELLIHEKAKPYMQKTYYINRVKVILAFLKFLFKHPVIICSLIFSVIRQTYKKYRELTKNIWCIFVGCYFSDMAQEKKIDHLHAHFATYPAFVAMVISKLTGITFTFTAHAHDIFLDKSLLKEKIEASAAVVTISEYNKKYLNDFYGQDISAKIRVIHCGIDLTEYSKNDKQICKKDNFIISVGRLITMKGFQFLINACAKMVGKITFNCVIIGEGPLRNELEKSINRLGLNKNFKLCGAMDNQQVKQMLKEAELFVLPSVWDDKDGQDGIPVALMEAMALGVPVISSRISGIPELVIDQETGLLVDPKLQESFAKSMLTLLKNQELQTKFSRQGKDKIEQDFDIVKNAQMLLNLFYELKVKKSQKSQSKV